MPGHLTKAIVSQWETDAYLAGFQAAMDASGTGLPPTDIDVSIFDPRKNDDVSQPTKRNNKVNAEERSNLWYDPRDDVILLFLRRDRERQRALRQLSMPRLAQDRTKTDVLITIKGEKYNQGESQYGKVFIPPQFNKYVGNVDDIHEMVIALTHVEYKNDKKINNVPFRALRVRPVRGKGLHKI